MWMRYWLSLVTVFPLFFPFTGLVHIFTCWWWFTLLHAFTISCVQYVCMYTRQRWLEQCLKLAQYMDYIHVPIKLISLSKKADLDVMQCHPLRKTQFSQYQAWSAAVGWPGDRNCYAVSHAQNAIRWLSQVDAYYRLTPLYNGLERRLCTWVDLKIINYSVLTSDCIFIQLGGKHRGRREKILTCSAWRHMYGVNIARNISPVINFHPQNTV